MAELSLSAKALPRVKADAIVVGLWKTPKGAQLAGAAELDAAFDGRLLRALSAVGATGAPGEVTRVPTPGSMSIPVVVAVGLGDQTPAAGDPAVAPDRLESLRRGAGAAVRALAGTARVALALPAESVEDIGAVAEGALLGAYAYLRFRTTTQGVKRPVATLVLLTGLARDRGAKVAAERAAVVSEATNVVRDLVNTPPSHLHPVELAAAATAAAAGLDVTVDVLDERALRRRGFGGILGVGQGSANPPRLVQLSYSPAGATRHVALVGKGVTFDSGGLSLKPPAAMVTMKCDMGGAAAVIAAVTAVAKLGLPLRVTGWVPMAENMPSGSAIRPSDVLTMYGGTTVEVLNTDAEGRLLLGDALAAACEQKPDAVIDIATLTGAQLIALGSRVGALMGNDDDLRDALRTAAARTGEAFWPMPLPPELRPSMDSPVADIANMGDRYGAMLVAGLFLQHFVTEGTPWAHLDIAGPAFNSGSAHGHTPVGGTGMSTRTLIALCEDFAARV